MNVDQAFPSQYLRASDLGAAEPIVTIARVALEAIGRDKDHKLIVYFEGKDKALVANKTIARKIAELVGSAETDDWIGQRVRLYVTTADFAGESFDVIRVKAAGSARPAEPAPPPRPRPRGVIESADDIPF